VFDRVSKAIARDEPAAAEIHRLESRPEIELGAPKEQVVQTH
jgi:hypothetical protein